MNKHGQSMIEYMFIAILIILGIVIMGPYVLRSVNAHFKLWDESVQDSATENLAQAPVSRVPDFPINCKCTDSGSAPSDCGISPCSSSQYYSPHQCIPAGCDNAPPYTCVPDSQCTETYDSGCGNFPCPASGCPSTPTTPLQGTSNNCYYGYEIQTQERGTSTTVQCIYNAQPTGNCPLPACWGTPNTGAVQCINEPPKNGVPLTQNINITYVATDTQANCLLISGCSALCIPPGGTPSSGPGVPDCTYCNPAESCQYSTAPPPTGCKNPPQLFQTPPRAHNGIWVPKDGSLNPDAICKAYGFTNGGYANLFPYPIQTDETTYNSGACHNSVNPQAYFVSTQPTATLSPQILAETSCQTSNDTSNAIFPYTFNGYTAYWAIVNNCDAGNWTYVWCFPNDYSSSNPNTLPDNATVCNYDIAPNDSNPNDNQCGAGKSPNNHPEYYQAVSFCGQNNPDGDSPACTVTCNPGYSTWTNTWGSVTLPTGCVKN